MSDGSNMTNILLETGTNELEMVEFVMGGNFYGINVAKVREIIRYPESVVPVPNAHPAITGVINLRGEIIPIINLPKHLGMKNENTVDATRIIVCEFNNFKVGFWVDSVNRIHRLSWKQLTAPSDVISAEAGSVVATVRIEERLILILDFEKIVASISPSSGIQRSEIGDFNPADAGFDRSTKTIMVAEDSQFIRGLMLDYLRKVNYKVIDVNNGQEALDVFAQITEKKDFKQISDHINLVVTDIEMPQIDGLHLVKRIKESKELKALPCVVFSSMITEELSLKCKAVGACAEITKPEIEGLVQLVDKHVL